MAESFQRAPFQLSVHSIKLYRFDGAEYVNISAQLLEFNLYESMFSPVITAEALIHDAIGLFHNFPLTGEQIVEVQLESAKQYMYGGAAPGQPIRNDEELEFRTMLFAIDSVDNVDLANDLHEMIYTIRLVSVEAVSNSFRKVSRTFTDTIDQIAVQMFEQHIFQQTALLFPTLYTKPFEPIKQNQWMALTPQQREQNKFLIYQSCEDLRDFYCPTINPLRFINMLTRHAQSHDQYSGLPAGQFVFFENRNGFNFLSVESILSDQVLKAIAEKPDNQFVYKSNSTVGRPVAEQKLITAIQYNSRVSNINKIAGGYFENVNIEIDLTARRFTPTNSVITRLVVDDPDPTAARLDRWSLNTDQYVQAIQVQDNNTFTDPEFANRVRYQFNNYNINRPAVNKAWGVAQQTVAALAQNDITITVPGDSTLTAGQLIYCSLPAVDGFTDETTQDNYLSGHFIVTECKHTVITGGRHATVMRINKNSFASQHANTTSYLEQSVKVR